MTLDDLRRLFEHSPWVADRALARGPFDTPDALHAALVEEVDRATPDEQLALLRAHPDLGARAKMTTASTAEQAGAGLDTLTPAEFDRLQTLNTAYRNKHGFPFILAVNGATKHDVLAAIERRLANSYETEFREALRQVCRIARFRLDALYNT
jgi:2-oxo-4-hydroxy-4-carboxy-5-ureidoimidazoline decarboxylase